MDCDGPKPDRHEHIRLAPGVNKRGWEALWDWLLGPPEDSYSQESDGGASRDSDDDLRGVPGRSFSFDAERSAVRDRSPNGDKQDGQATE